MSSLVLPSYTATADQSWQLVDFLDVSARTEPAAGGRCTLTLEQLDPGELWLLDHLVCQVLPATTAKSTLRLYSSYEDPLRILDGTSSGSFNVGEWTAGLQLHPSESLHAVWAGAPDGSRGFLRVQGRKMRRV